MHASSADPVPFESRAAESPSFYVEKHYTEHECTTIAWDHHASGYRAGLRAGLIVGLISVALVTVLFAGGCWLLATQ